KINNALKQLILLLSEQINTQYLYNSFSNEVVVTRQPNRPQMFSGESITLTCEVQGGETTEWTCEWRRDGKTVKVGNNKHLTVRVNESSSEEYRCQYQKTNLLNVGSVIDPVLTVEPNWSTFYVGEFVTFICDMNHGRDTDWFYRLIRNNQDVFPYRSDKRFNFQHLSTGYRHDFQCCAQRSGSSYKKCSKTVTVTVSDKPGAKLTAGSTTIPVGGSVILSCSVEPSAGWKYRWFRRTSDSSFVEFNTNNEENREITVTQGGIYMCDGKRGNPSFYSHSTECAVRSQDIIFFLHVIKVLFTINLILKCKIIQIPFITHIKLDFFFFCTFILNIINWPTLWYKNKTINSQIINVR
uniref:Ig-like domain-containing protein n=1 Tax=Xiphophorus maculatus TaxID=8083 RepID=A0A3B5QND1_XIPMA